MNWTTKVPQEPGWYWFKGQIGSERSHYKVLHLERSGAGTLRSAKFGGLLLEYSDLESFTGEWAGPFGIPHDVET
jgi:hypothetical protein